jgi:hypothetical protein
MRARARCNMAVDGSTTKQSIPARLSLHEWMASAAAISRTRPGPPSAVISTGSDESRAIRK